MRTIMTENNCRAGALTSEQSAILIACAHRLDEVESQYLAEELRSVQRDLLAASPVEQHEAAPADAEFKNFHRLLCERFGYVHDEHDWKRDQLSLIECIANWRDQFEFLDVQNHRARQAMRRIMARLTELLDEDRFAEIEEIVRNAGVEPPPVTAQPEPPVADERAAFERELVKRIPNAQLQLRDADDEIRPGEYEHPTHEFAWRMWQAARASSPNAAGAEGADERAVMGRLYEVACDALGRVAQALGLDLADTRTELILGAIEELKAQIAPAQAAEPVAIPVGCAFVPIEPIDEMITAGIAKGDSEFYGDALVRAEVRSDYQAMIAAAPAFVRYQIRTEEGGWLDVPQAYYERFKSDMTLARAVNLIQATTAHDESSIEKHFDDYGFYLHGFEEEDREAFFQAALALVAAPPPPAPASAIPEIDPPQAGGNKGKLPALARTREGHNLYALGYNRGLKKGRDEGAPASAPVGLTDEQIIERCEAAGIKWIPPELPDECDHEIGFQGSFDMADMDAMRALLEGAKHV
ncbi:hypothetical protein [Burkholderia cenocepacia]|uniref:hypothetical protein n=1 Tax=Burkholderia cenocepacia TaxID=95486 RepID=UPI0020113406|nr:hypothetical protein [Burkholderia cenocepacia]